MTLIKICGIRDVETALSVGRSGANFLGLVFAPSQRLVSSEKALDIVKAVHQLNPRPSLVGVFANAEIEEVNRISRHCQLDYVQLSGDESWEYCREIEGPVIKVIHVSGNRSATDVLQEIEAGDRLLSGKRHICLLDTGVSNSYGGTGQTFDWQIARAVAMNVPVMVAGGLTPDNVSQLVNEVKPYGVDVSSGVETNGQKDINKIRAFVAAVYQVAPESGR